MTYKLILNQNLLNFHVVHASQLGIAAEVDSVPVRMKSYINGFNDEFKIQFPILHLCYDVISFCYNIKSSSFKNVKCDCDVISSRKYQTKTCIYALWIMILSMQLFMTCTYARISENNIFQESYIYARNTEIFITFTTFDIFKTLE